jgi:DNA-binding transcriptional MocR family regulator
LRLGFLAASSDLIPYIGRLKQAADLHSNRISQFLVLDQLRKPGRAAQLQQLAMSYRDKRDGFAAQLQRHFGDLATWHTPVGGLFFWMQLNRMLDTRQLLPKAIARNVAFMPGEAFYPDSPPATGTLRLNFSHASAEAAERGLAILADIVRNAVLGNH